MSCSNQGNSLPMLGCCSTGNDQGGEVIFLLGLRFGVGVPGFFEPDAAFAASIDVLARIPFTGMPQISSGRFRITQPEPNVFDYRQTGPLDDYTAPIEGGAGAWQYSWSSGPPQGPAIYDTLFWKSQLYTTGAVPKRYTDYFYTGNGTHLTDPDTLTPVGQPIIEQRSVTGPFLIMPPDYNFEPSPRGTLRGRRQIYFT